MIHKKTVVTIPSLFHITTCISSVFFISSLCYLLILISDQFHTTTSTRTYALILQANSLEMVGLSNPIITTLNVLTLVVSLVAIVFATWLHLNSGATPCARGLQRPVFILGVLLLAVSLVGLVGSWRRISALLWTYLGLLLVFILGMMCFTVFTIVVTNKNVGRALSGKGYNEARLGDYSHWLQKYVVNAENWDEIKSCLVEINFCQNLAQDKGPQFYKNSVAATQVVNYIYTHSTLLHAHLLCCHYERLLLP